MTQVYSPADNLVGPIIQQLANIAQTNITGITEVYIDEPDGAPEDNSLEIGLAKYDVLDDTNGKLKLLLTFSLRFRRTRVTAAQDLPALRSYVIPFLMAYSSWGAQDLAGDSMLVTVKQGGITQDIRSGQPYRTLITNVQVLTEFNIDVS